MLPLTVFITISKLISLKLLVKELILVKQVGQPVVTFFNLLMLTFLVLSKVFLELYY